MRHEILATGIQCRDLDTSLRFYRDYSGMHTVDFADDAWWAAHREELETRLVPRLFGFTGHGRVRFRSQLIRANDTRDSFYELFEWVHPRWVDDEPYTSSNHVGAYRSQTAVDDIDYLRRRHREFGARFVSEETPWWGSEYASLPEPPHHEPSMLTIDPDGFRMQTRQVEGLPGEKTPFHPVRMIRHREINVVDVEDSARFYHDVLGMHLAGTSHADPMPAFPTLAELAEGADPALSKEYIDNLRHRELAEFFGFPAGITVDIRGTMMQCEGSAQKLDLFEWVNPKAYGRAYRALNHIGYQRLTFTVPDIDAVSRSARAWGAEIVSDVIDTPPLPLPGLDETATKAMSLRDPNGVLLIVLGD
ncbi:VOC family protein [Streptomyces shenzhenensis]|uniref:VOC family protein n=1 Tax=Streptomyces shenzhenensis TaxID=943815 RepID=UPI0033BFFEDB